MAELESAVPFWRNGDGDRDDVGSEVVVSAMMQYGEVYLSTWCGCGGVAGVWFTRCLSKQV